MTRPAAALAVLLALVLYSVFPEELPALSDWGDVAVLALVVIPAMFALVWLALPLREFAGAWWLAFFAGATALLAVALSLADFETPANVAKFAAATLVGWWFLVFFESAWWVVLVAILIVPVDLYSVARGPTREITENQPQVFDALSVFMRIPGESPTANLGLPDVLFFALFLGATVRFRLRTAVTWVAMTLSFGATLAIAVGLDEAGVAALPLLSAAFVVVNLDLLLRRRRQRAGGEVSE